MPRTLKILMAGFSVFIGSLLADVAFGDGIQGEDVSQAITLALIAAIVQAFLTLRRVK